MQHLIWNMSSTIKNGLFARKKSILHPSKSVCVNILKVLYKEGFINGFRRLPKNPEKIEIFFKYMNGKPVITKISAISTPGRRIYLSVSSLWKLKTSLTTYILSTPRGILSDKECRKYNLGGELLYILQ
jgi:small subunit ribosomal protein S8